MDENENEVNDQEQLKKNLMNNIDMDDNCNSKNNNNIDYKNNNIKDKNINENSEQTNLNYYKQNQLKNNIQEVDIKKPYFFVYYEKVNINSNSNINNIIKEENEDNEQLNDIEKLNKELNAKNNINNKDYSWYCLDFSEEKPEYIFDNFFNNQ